MIFTFDGITIYSIAVSSKAFEPIIFNEELPTNFTSLRYLDFEKAPSPIYSTVEGIENLSNDENEKA